MIEVFKGIQRVSRSVQIIMDSLRYFFKCEHAVHRAYRCGEKRIAPIAIHRQAQYSCFFIDCRLYISMFFKLRYPSVIQRIHDANTQ